MASPKKKTEAEVPQEVKDQRKDLDEALKLLDENNPYASYLSENTLSNVNEWINTGSYVLNAIISGDLYGGVPVGRLTLLSGESQTGKSYIIQRVAANAQKQGKIVVIFDTENAIDAQGAKKLGLDTTRVKYCPVFSIEQVRNDCYRFLEDVKRRGLENKFFIVIDSLGNLSSEQQLKKMSDEKTSLDMGSRAKALKDMLRTLTQLAALTRTTILCTNHIYADPSAMFESLIKIQSGGSGVIYLPSVTIQLARRPVKEEEAAKMSDTAGLAVGQKNYSGVVLRALTAKNRFAKQFLEGEMFLSYSTGLDKYHGLLDYLVGFGVVQFAISKSTGVRGTTAASGYEAWDGTYLGRYSSWKDDEEIWAKLLPELQKHITSNWLYGTGDAGTPEIEEPSGISVDSVAELSSDSNRKTKMKPTLLNELTNDE